jgi:outer membrane protein OmpA-like peptidoglycan-associated protein
MKKFIFLLSIIIINTNLFAQNSLSTENKKARKNYSEAIKYYNSYDVENALKYINNAIKADENFIEAYWFRAELYYRKKDTIATINDYKKVISIDSNYSSKIYYELAGIYLKKGDYANALKNYKEANNFEDLHPRISASIEAKIKQAEFCLNSIQHPVPFIPKNLGKNVNTEYDDYWPMVTADDQILYTTKLIPVDNRFPINQKNAHEDFFYNIKEGEDWGKLRHMSKAINTKMNEGAPSISADGQWFYFTACQRPDGQGRCDIYKTQKIGQRWLKPINLGPPVNTSAWESQPAVSADGRTLYFTADRKGGKGGMDIWVSHLQNDATWTVPKNLGDTINTEGKEMSPFIHPDGRTLYFTSDTHIGFGDQDIFLSRMDDNGHWSNPKNLGYPINTKENERGIALNNRGNLAYISAVREGKKDLDIYSFELYNEIRPIPSTYVSGVVYDSETKQKLYAEFQLINLNTSKKQLENFSDKETGKYLITLPANTSYAFNVSKKGYLFFSENFTLNQGYNIDKPYKMDIPLQPIKEGANVILKNVFFELDSYTLKPESKIELDKLVNFINQNQNIKIEIGGHTDNQGSIQHNQILSENRAKAVYNYLINNGIEKSFLSYKGYGQDKPIAENNTEKGRALNRRTEAKIINVRK